MVYTGEILHSDHKENSSTLKVYRKEAWKGHTSGTYFEMLPQEIS